MPTLTVLGGSSISSPELIAALMAAGAASRRSWSPIRPTQANCASEQLLAEAVMERSYEKAWRAMTLHPLVRDSALAREILALIWPDGLRQERPVTPDRSEPSA